MPLSFFRRSIAGDICDSVVAQVLPILFRPSVSRYLALSALDVREEPVQDSIVPVFSCASECMLCLVVQFLPFAFTMSSPSSCRFQGVVARFHTRNSSALLDCN